MNFGFARTILQLIAGLPISTIAEINELTQRILSSDITYHSQLQKQFWDTRSKEWITYDVPFRPSQHDIAQYRFILDLTKTKDRILLLGSTPELRELLAEYYHLSSIFLCDFSWMMLESMSIYANSADPEKEIWLKADWHDLTLPDQFFDIIMGDLLLFQIHPERETQFIKRVYDLLSSKGIFIMRCRFRKEGFFDSQNLIYSALLSAADRPADKLATKLLWELLDVNTNQKTRLISYENIYDAISIYIKAHGEHEVLVRLKEDLAVCQTKFSFRWKWACQNKNSFFQVASRYFEIEDLTMLQTKSQTAEYPILMLKKKPIQISK